MTGSAHFSVPTRYARNFLVYFKAGELSLRLKIRVFNCEDKLEIFSENFLNGFMKLEKVTPTNWVLSVDGRIKVPWVIKDDKYTTIDNPVFTYCAATIESLLKH